MREQEQVGTGLSDEAIQWLIALDCGSADTEAFEAWWKSLEPGEKITVQFRGALKVVRV